MSEVFRVRRDERGSGLGAVDDLLDDAGGVGHGDGDAALAETGFGLGVERLACLGDVDAGRLKGDVAGGRLEVATREAQGLTSLDL